jgi:hypothetical protein
MGKSSDDYLFDDFVAHWFGNEIIHASRQTASQSSLIADAVMAIMGT